jgi:hypothetical protein
VQIPVVAVVAVGVPLIAPVDEIVSQGVEGVWYNWRAIQD